MKILIPEIFFSTSILSLLWIDSLLINNYKLNFPLIQKEILITTLLLLCYTLCLYTNMQLLGYDAAAIFLFDSANYLIKILIIVISILSVPFIWRAFLLQRLNLMEFFIIFLFSILGSLLIINCYDFLSLYLCLELQALCFYILSSFYRKSLHSSEAGLKYFISSSVFSSIFLFGVVCIFCVFGTTNFLNLSILMTGLSDSNFLFIAQIGFFCILNSFFFKLVIAPLHFWFPLIYDGVPIASLIIFMLIPKLSLFIIFMKFFFCFDFIFFLFKNYCISIGCFSVLYGIVEGFKQKRLKKLLIYSSISQMGLPLCALSINTEITHSLSLFFILIYLLTSIGLWGIYVFLCSNIKLQYSYWLSQFDFYPIYITFFKSIKSQNYSISIIISMLFFSLAGLPPFIGFLSKIYIYISLLKHSNYEVAVFLIFLGVGGIFYYTRVIKSIFFEQISTINYKFNSRWPQKCLLFDCVIISNVCILLCFYFFNSNGLLFLCQLIVQESRFF